MSSALNLADLADRARAALPAPVWDFIDGGSGDEATLAGNRAAFGALRLVPRVLRDVSDPALACPLFGTEAAMPVGIAPMAYQRMVHPDGELASARAAKAAGVPFTVSMLSSTSVERVAEAGGTVWFQLYWLRDRGRSADLLDRAAAAGCRALVLTVDVPRLGLRLRDMRNGFAVPDDVLPVHLAEGVTAVNRSQPGRSAVAGQVEDAIDPSLTWADLEWLRERTRLPLVLKGILDPNDAARAADLGVDGIVVSNHGGRQLDGAIAPIDALPAVREAAGDLPVLLDSGVRGGLDVLRALARGATAVLLGRPVLWGLVDGEAGVARVLAIVRDELAAALALAGCPDLTTAARLKLG